MLKVSPSVLSADFSKLAFEIKDIVDKGADMIHLDVMDGNFVTNISFGIPVIKSIRKVTDAFFDVHLMIDKPERYIERFIDSGADLITFHIEATEVPEKCIELIKNRSVKAAISVKPNTDIKTVYPFLDKLDMVLVMTVEPGYGGQKIISECLSKVVSLKEEIQRRNLNVEIQVDGGINKETAILASNAGADILVAGNAVFQADDRKEIIDFLKNPI